MENNEKGIALWNSVLKGAMSIPGVAVSRRAFLVEKLNPYLDQQQLISAININPTKIVKKDVIDKIADNVIKSHTAAVTLISTAAGIPGGLIMGATVPADLAQYYYHCLVLSQKLAYLYGWPDLIDKNGKLSEDAVGILTLFIGIMSGVAVASEAINWVARELSKQVVKRLPKMALTKTIIYPIVKQVAKWLGVSMTKETFAKGLGKAIPFVGGAISGGLTYVSFRPSAKRLKKKLSEQSQMFRNVPSDNTTSDNFISNVEDVEYEQL